MFKLLKIFWYILRRDQFVFYSVRKNKLIYRMPESELKYILQNMSVEAGKQYYNKNLI